VFHGQKQSVSNAETNLKHFFLRNFYVKKIRKTLQFMNSQPLK